MYVREVAGQPRAASRRSNDARVISYSGQYYVSSAGSHEHITSEFAFLTD